MPAKYFRCVEVDKAAVGLLFLYRYRTRFLGESYSLRTFPKLSEAQTPCYPLVEQGLTKLNIQHKQLAQLVITSVRVCVSKAIVKGKTLQKQSFCVSNTACRFVVMTK